MLSTTGVPSFLMNGVVPTSVTFHIKRVDDKSTVDTFLRHIGDYCHGNYSQLRSAKMRSEDVVDSSVIRPIFCPF